MAEFSDFEDEEGVEEPVLTDEERSEIDEEVSGTLYVLDIASFLKTNNLAKRTLAALVCKICGNTFLNWSFFISLFYEI